MSDSRMISELQRSGFVTLVLELCRSLEISVSTYGTSFGKITSFVNWEADYATSVSVLGEVLDFNIISSL
jgi:hypothetical protein